MFSFKNTSSRLFKNRAEIAIFIFSLSLYVVTSSRSIVQGDTGEFLAAAATHGVPHAPGYPLYSIITRLAFLLPLGQSVWQLNIISGVFASLSLVFVYKIVKLITGNVPSALFAVLALATYESFWFYALVAEVHTLQVFLFSLLFYFLLLSLKERRIRYLYLAGLIWGLGASNNHAIVFTAPSFLIVLFRFRKELTIDRIFKLAGFSVLGLLPYIYTFWASSTTPPVNWGRVHDIGSFISLFLRRDFGTFFQGKPEPPAPFIYNSLIYYFTSIMRSSWFILPFSLASLYYLWKKNVSYIILLCSFVLVGPLLYLAINLPIRSVIHQANISQQLSYSFFFLSIFAGLGLFRFIKGFDLKNLFFLSIAVVLFFAITAFSTFQKVRLDNNRLTETTSKFQLSQIPENSVILTWSDSLYMPALYWQHLENYRSDITIVQLGLANLAWYKENLTRTYPQTRDYIDGAPINYDKVCESFAKDGLLFMYPWFPEFDSVFGEKCVIIPYGLVAKVVPVNEKPDVNRVKSDNDKIWKEYSSLLTSFDNYVDSYVRTRETLFYVGEHLNYMGIYYQREGRLDWALDTFQLARQVSLDEINSRVSESAILVNKGETARAIEVLEEGIRLSPVTPELYKNLAVIYESRNQRHKAYENFKKYVSFDPTGDSDLDNIKKFISAYERGYRSF